MTQATSRFSWRIVLAATPAALLFTGCGHSSSAPPAETAAKSAADGQQTASATETVEETSAHRAPAAVAIDPRDAFFVKDRDLYDRAVKLQNDEKFAEAGTLFEQIVAFNAEFCGDQHYRTRFARNRLRENQWMASLSSDDRKKLRDSRTLGDTSMEDRGQKRFAAAVDHTRQAAEILAAIGGRQTIAFGKLSELNAAASADLAALNGGDITAADRSLRAAIDAYGRTVGHPSLEEASALAAMGELYAMHGDIGPSLQCVKQSIAAESACRVAGMPDAMASYLLSKLGRRYRDLGQFDLAEQVFKQSVNLARITLGLRSQAYVDSTQDLAATYLYEEKLQEAVSLELEVLELMDQSSAGQVGPTELLARGLLGCAYVQMGKTGMASPVLLRTLDLARNTIDPHSADAAYIGLLEGGVAELYIAKKQYQQAEPLLAHALAMAEPKNNGYKPWYVRLLSDQITMLHGLGRDAETAKPQAKRDTMEAGRVALCGKLRDAGILPKSSTDAAAEIASRPTTTR
jgi:tetratricopeptide (TPR) repeat protein